MISVGISALPEAPLISDSPFYKQPRWGGWCFLKLVGPGPVGLHAAGHAQAGSGRVLPPACPQSVLVGAGMEMEGATCPP